MAVDSEFEPTLLFGVRAAEESIYHDASEHTAPLAFLLFSLLQNFAQ
jgi:hypothetical protein